MNFRAQRQYSINGQYVIKTYPKIELMDYNHMTALMSMSYDEVKELQAEWDQIEKENNLVYGMVQAKLRDFIYQSNALYVETFGNSFRPLDMAKISRFNPYDNIDVRDFLEQPKYKHNKVYIKSLPVGLKSARLIDVYESIKREIDIDKEKQKRDQVENMMKVSRYLDFCEELGILRKVVGLNYDKLIKTINKLCKSAIQQHETVNMTSTLEGDLLVGFAYISSNNVVKMSTTYAYNDLVAMLKGTSLLDSI